MKNLTKNNLLIIKIMVSASNIWLVDILNILLSTLIISSLLSSLSSTNFNENNLKLYENNWSSGLLKNIRQCLNNDTDYLINEKFPSTNVGCSCEFSSLIGLKGNLFPFLCTNFYNENSCKIFFGSEMQNITKWNNEEWCSEKFDLKYFDYLEEIKLEKEIINDQILVKKSCKEGYKKCGILDSYDQPLCIISSKNCPINNILKSDDNNLSLNKEKSNFKKFSDNFYYSTDSINNTVVNTFKVSINGQCAYPIEGNIGENNYILNSNKGLSNCKTLIKNKIKDHRYKNIDSVKITTLYYQNGISVDSFPLYPQDYKVQNSILQTTGYFGIKVECFIEYKQKLDSKILINLQNETKSINNMILIPAIIGMTQFVISILFIIIYKILISKFKPLYIGIIIFDVINCCFLITIIIFSFKSRSSLYKITDPFLYLKEKECIDEYTTYLFNKEYDKLFIVIGNLSVVIGFSMTFIILLIINYTLIIFMKNDPIIIVKLK